MARRGNGSTVARSAASPWRLVQFSRGRLCWICGLCIHSSRNPADFPANSLRPSCLPPTLGLHRLTETSWGLALRGTPAFVSRTALADPITGRFHSVRFQRHAHLHMGFAFGRFVGGGLRQRLGNARIRNDARRRGPMPGALAANIRVGAQLGAPHVVDVRASALSLQPGQRRRAGTPRHVVCR
jgi:hypothetical protein